MIKLIKKKLLIIYIFLTIGKEVAESWYKENLKYNFATPGFQSGTGRLFIHSHQLKSLNG